LKKRGRRLKRFLGLRREAGITYSGGIEHLLPGQISGWIVAKGVPFQEVRLLVGPHLIARAEINQPRPDVCESLGWQGSPGFCLGLPAQLPPLDWQPSPRLLALTADGSQQMELRLMARPEQTTELLKTLLQSELLGLEGHFDGLLLGSLRGWAGRRGQRQPVQIWLQGPGQPPWPLPCNQWRDGMQAMGLPERCGFSIDPSALPTGWEGLEVWCSFDEQGQFRLPQLETVMLPAAPTLAGAGVSPVQTQAPLEVVPSTGRIGAFATVPEDLRPHWQALENFRVYLDTMERELDARDQQQQLRTKAGPWPSWWLRLIGASR
jgi:hypothetical protein